MIHRSSHTPFTYIFNYSHNPTIVIPCGETPVPGDDPDLPVPVGLQIVASKSVSLEKHLQFAKFCENLFGTGRRPRWASLSYLNSPNVTNLKASDTNMTAKKFKQVTLGKKYQPDYRLVYQQQILDDSRSLSSYGITTNSLLQLVDNTRMNTLAY